MPTVAELRARVTPANAQYLEVKPGAKLHRCAKCDADKLYWGVTSKGKLTLVDCGVMGGAEPTATKPGRGVNHYATCPRGREFGNRR